MAVFI